MPSLLAISLAVALAAGRADSSVLGYPVAGLLAGLGIGGRALALAAQKTVENLFGSVALAVDQPQEILRQFIAVVEQAGTRFAFPTRMAAPAPSESRERVSS